MVRKYLFNTLKLKYIKEKKPEVECILCAIRDRLHDVRKLELLRTDKFIIAVNLYPLNPGHLMIFPQRHVEDVREITDDEALEMHYLLAKSVSVIIDEFNPSGFNIGYNLGAGSGASISHIHQHIVPRYKNEVGFLDVLAGTRIVVVDPVEMMERLKKRFAEGVD